LRREHTAEGLRELGYDDAEIEAMVSHKAVKLG